MPATTPRRQPLPAAAALTLAVLAVSCARTGVGSPPADGLRAGPGSPAADAACTLPRPPAPRLAFPLTGGGGGAVQVVRAFPNLSFTEPLDLASPRDGSNRVFVATKSGHIHVFANDDNVAASTVFLDISARVYDWWEVGLLGFTFDPNYRTNGYFYVHYVDHSFDSHISQFRVSGSDPNRADPGSERELIRVRQPEGNHNGGGLQFGPDGMLYIALGDGGGLDDRYGNSQNPNTLLGSMLRIDPHGSTGGLPYAIPADNPLVGRPGRDEIWAWGLRSPWRFTIDDVTGELWLGDVGQDFHEEINLVRRGGNYAWPVYEGAHSLINPNNLPYAAFDPPLLIADRADMRSVIGGHVYRGARMPSHVGSYVFGDWVYGRIWALQRSGGQVTTRLLGHVSHVAAIGVDPTGELLAVSHDGTIHRFVEQVVGGGFPTRLSQTGLLTDTRSLAWANGLLSYEVNSPLWSDNARKIRLVTLPDAERIGFRADSSWDLPTGTVLVKHFELEMTLGQPSTARRLETRVMVRQQAGWAGYTYRWNQAQDDADLLTAAATETFTIRDANASGGQRQQTWTYPGPSDCVQCHTVAAGHVLGFRTAQTNRDVQVAPGVVENQLDRWNRMCLFTTDIGSPSSEPRLADPRDRQASLDARVRSYLDANCAHCHRPGGAIRGEIDLRAESAEPDMGLIGLLPTRGTLGLADPFRIKPGEAHNSVLWQRMLRLDGFRMPLIGSGLADLPATDLIGEWIRRMGSR